MNTLMILLKKKWVQLTIALVVGVTIGALFYPQSRVEERLKKEYKEEYSLKEQETQKEHNKSILELEEKLSISESSNKEKLEETSSKLEKLTQENSYLKQSIKKQKFKIVKPDGTVIEKEIEESNTEQTHSMVTQVREEFTRKVQEIENKWKQIHQDRIVYIRDEYEKELERVRAEQKTIEVVIEKERIVEVNKKKLRTEVGVTTNKDAYAHGSYSLWGPVFIGGGISGTNKSFGEIRAGIGLEL